MRKHRLDIRCTLVELQKLYASLDEDDRHTVNHILENWLLGSNIKKRFDAEGLMNHFHIADAIPALRVAYDSTAGVIDPPIRYRRKN